MIFCKYFKKLLVGAFVNTPLVVQALTLSCPHEDISFKVEVPQTQEERAKGLMSRERLAADEGMLFLHSKPTAVAMWMKNTPLSLDMIFCNEKGKILAIYENTLPYSLDVIGPVEGTTQVLEILAGTVLKRGITYACILRRDL